VQQAIAGGEIGPLELPVITSRDPGPPPPRAILEACGGLFRDTSIHDFDMARFVMGEEPVEVYAMAANRVDPIFAELNDVDTAMIVMCSESGALCHINNSRRTNYGYDQRVEAFGMGGMVRSDNLRTIEISRHNAQGSAQRDDLLYFFIERYRMGGMVRSDNLRTIEISRHNAQGSAQRDDLLYFFIERYRAAYEAEIRDFIDNVAAGRDPNVTFEDGRRALIVAEAAIASWKGNRPVEVNF
jgi:myo-inositol 2-dehydrogenase/D-chiro-inositol 1-dehydrogenase